MNVRLLAPAAGEPDEAVAWCAAQAPRLERRFIDEMGTARKRIAERPQAWRPSATACGGFGWDVSRTDVVKADEIVVLAVAHLHRKPNYWRSRQPRPTP
jgi:hypothetical protein